MRDKRRGNVLMRLLPEWTWNYNQRKPLTPYRPGAVTTERKTVQPEYKLLQYDGQTYEERNLTETEACNNAVRAGKVMWLDVDGLQKEAVQNICSCYGVHPLITEDILSTGQRAKMDEIDDIIYCLLPMLYYNDDTGQVQIEQVSLVLGNGFILLFQEDNGLDVFEPVRQRIRNGYTKLRQRPADYLCYSLIDIIVDSYFDVIDKINNRIEKLEDDVLLQKEQAAIARISILRREVLLMRRTISPVRDVVNGFLRSESDLLEERHDKYYKDVLDHTIIASEYVENHRDMLMNMQDLFVSQVNTRMNEVMKVFTMVTTLLAPATVIGGIFGMNFEVIPLAHQHDGFYITVAAMLIIPLFMLVYFKRKGWF